MNTFKKKTGWISLVLVLTFGLALSSCSASKKHCEGMSSAKSHRTLNR